MYLHRYFDGLDPEGLISIPWVVYPLSLTGAIGKKMLSKPPLITATATATAVAAALFWTSSPLDLDGPQRRLPIHLAGPLASCRPHHGDALLIGSVQ